MTRNTIKGGFHLKGRRRGRNAKPEMDGKHIKGMGWVIILALIYLNIGKGCVVCR